MKKLILILSFLLIAWTPVCRHNALYIASVVGEEYPVKIAYGYSDNKVQQTNMMKFAPPFNNPTIYNDLTELHVQAKALVDGKWVWLGIKDGQIVVTNQDHFSPTTEYTFEEFTRFMVKEQKK